jgi:hypothetical protein
VLVRHVGGGAEIVERTAVHVAGLEADDRRPCRAARLGREHAAQVGDIDRTLRVRRHRLDGSRAQAEKPQRAVDGAVPLVVRDDPHPRPADEPALLDVPTRLGEHVVPGDASEIVLAPCPPVAKPKEASAGRPSSSLSHSPAMSSTTAAAAT